MRNQQFGFRPGLTQNGLYSHRRWLEAGNFGFRKKRNCTIRVAKTKVPLFLPLQIVGFPMGQLVL